MIQSLSDNRKPLPVKLSAVNIDDQMLTVTVEALSDTERASLLERIRMAYATNTHEGT